MPFTPTTWADGAGGGTPITHTELNRIETGIDQLWEVADRDNGKLVPDPAAFPNTFLDRGVTGDRIHARVDSSIVAAFVGGANPRVLVPGGTVGTPGLVFLGDENTGVYRVDPDIWGLVAGGAEKLRLGSNVTVVGAATQLRVQSGSVSAPGVAFNADPDSGMWWESSVIGWHLTHGGVSRLDITGTGPIVPAGNAFVSFGNNHLTMSIDTGVDVQADTGASPPLLVRASSTERIKKAIRADVEPYRILGVDPVSYEFKLSAFPREQHDRLRKKGRQLGVIAEQAVTVEPKIVHRDAAGRPEYPDPKIAVWLLLATVRHMADRLDALDGYGWRQHLLEVPA